MFSNEEAETLKEVKLHAQNHSKRQNQNLDPGRLSPESLDLTIILLG